MLKNQGRWASSVRVAGLGLVFILSVTSTVKAQEPGVSGTTTRNPRVRTATPTTQTRTQVRPGTQARPVPVRPRPIQDETTPRVQAPASASGATSATAPAATVPASAPRPAPRRVQQEEAVDLGALTSSSDSSSAPTGRSSATSGMSPHQSSGILPNFKFYFDFLLKSWKGDDDSAPFTFDSYHQKVLAEFTPNPDLMFQADISPSDPLQFFEVDYMLSKSIQLRWGRIWIPFDDMAPHAIFGGRIDTREFRQENESNFLPDIWADLGMGLKFALADSSSFASDLHAYVVNGFQANTSSPVSGEGNVIPYPNFAGTTGSTNDNNNAKGMGARWHGLFGRRFGLGASVYKDTYTSRSAPEQKGLFMAGADVQLYPTSTTDIRAGFITMKVDLYSPPAAPIAKTSFTRGGSYVELGQKFGFENRWKFLVRAGKSQNDNRVVDVSDKTLVGVGLLRNFGSVEAQLSYYRDLNKVPSKVAYNYGALRLVTSF